MLTMLQQRGRNESKARKCAGTSSKPPQNTLPLTLPPDWQFSCSFWSLRNKDWGAPTTVVQTLLEDTSTQSTRQQRSDSGLQRLMQPQKGPFGCWVGTKPREPGLSHQIWPKREKTRPNSHCQALPHSQPKPSWVSSCKVRASSCAWAKNC